MNIFHSVAELAGNTPLLELCRYERRHGLNARILPSSSAATWRAAP